jgi:cob(I)alamin adenosyltransferase
MPRIYTKTGDDGTTGLLYGGRIHKSDPVADAYGTTDEAVAVLGLARALCGDDVMANTLLVLQRELFVVGADLAANPDERGKLQAGVSLVDEAMTRRLEQQIDDLVAERPLPATFVVPGAVELERTGRTVNPEVRRYLNRLSDLLFVLARWQAGESEPASRADRPDA